MNAALVRERLAGIRVLIRLPFPLGQFLNPVEFYCALNLTSAK
jgi:hypothetical protein